MSRALLLLLLLFSGGCASWNRDQRSTQVRPLFEGMPTREWQFEVSPDAGSANLLEPGHLVYSLADGTASFGASFEPYSLKNARALRLQIQAKPSVLVALRLQSTNGTFQDVALDPYLRAQGRTLTATVPLAAFHDLPSTELLAISYLGLVLQGTGKVRIISIRETAHSTAGPQPSRPERGNDAVESRPPRGVPAGHAVYLRPQNTAAIEALKRRNDITFAFVYAGTFGANLESELEAVMDTLPGLAGHWVFPVLVGNAADLPEDPRASNRLAEAIANLGRKPQFAGLHIILAPFNARTRSFLNSINARLNKPLSAAIPVTAPAARVRVCDLSVLYGLSEDHEQKVAAFRLAAEEADRRLLMARPEGAESDLEGDCAWWQPDEMEVLCRELPICIW